MPYIISPVRAFGTFLFDALSRHYDDFLSLIYDFLGRGMHTASI